VTDTGRPKSAQAGGPDDPALRARDLFAPVATRRHFARESLLWREGDDDGNLVSLVAGHVKIYRVLPTGAGVKHLVAIVDLGDDRPACGALLLGGLAVALLRHLGDLARVEPPRSSSARSDGLQRSRRLQRCCLLGDKSRGGLQRCAVPT
jgi:hypothetical protein